MSAATRAPSGRVAIVVAGGSARRMGGVDKLGLEVGGLPMLDRVLGSARALCDEVVVVGPVRPTAVDGATFTSEAVPGGGPVPAVAAGLDVLDADAAVAVLAGDLPLLTTAHLEVLFAALSDPAVEAAAALAVVSVPLGSEATLNVNGPADLERARSLVGTRA